MTVRVERTFELAASPERVWEFISNPENRARAISVVTDYEVDPENGRKATWQIELPIPVLRRSVSVRTEDVTVREPEYVEFVGRSKVMRVRGEHEIVPTGDGCRVENRFVVDGRLPGVERFFKKNFDAELENLEATLRHDLGIEA